MSEIVTVFLHDWSSAEEVYKDFENDWGSRDYPIENKDDIQILFASYSYENYSGDAFVLYYDHEQGGLFEVNGGHCSYYSLKGQWKPEPVTVKELRHRIDAGHWGRNDWCGNEFADELAEFLTKYEGELF
jgi:hypothetical protein